MSVYIPILWSHTHNTHTDTCNLELKKKILKQTETFWKAEPPP